MWVEAHLGLLAESLRELALLVAVELVRAPVESQAELVSCREQEELAVQLVELN